MIRQMTEKAQHILALYIYIYIYIFFFFLYYLIFFLLQHHKQKFIHVDLSKSALHLMT